MIIYKTIQVSIDIENPISTFINPETNLINELTSKYENTCFAGCFILKVMNIVKRSECIITQTNESGNGSIDIIFKAKVIILHPNEILSDCKVLKKDNDRKLIIAQNDICALNVNTNDIYNSITIGQKIPVMIKKSFYAVGGKRIQAFAEPYVPTTESIVYNFKGAKVSQNDMNIIFRLYKD